MAASCELCTKTDCPAYPLVASVVGGHTVCTSHAARVIPAKFAGKCGDPMCSGSIKAGESVVWAKGYAARHVAGKCTRGNLAPLRGVKGCMECARLGQMCPSCLRDA